MQGSDRMIENKSGGALSPEGKHFGSLEKRALVQRWKDDKIVKAAIQENGKRPAFSNQRSRLGIMSLSMPDYKGNLVAI